MRPPRNAWRLPGFADIPPAGQRIESRRPILTFFARAASVGHTAWVAARDNSDYAAFAPYLKRNLELARRYVDCFDGFDCAYDALLDDFEPGMKTEQVSRLFAELKSELERGTERTLDDLNPLKVFRERK